MAGNQGGYFVVVVVKSGKEEELTGMIKKRKEHKRSKTDKIHDHRDELTFNK